MTTALPSRSALLVDAQGRMSEAWWRFIQELYQWSGRAGPQFPLYHSAMVDAWAMAVDFAAPTGTSALSLGIEARSFAAGVSSRLQFGVVLPFGFTSGSELVPCVRWAPTTANSGAVVWALEYTIASVDDALPAGATAVLEVDAAGVAHEHQSELGAAISGSGIRPGAMAMCSIFRDGANPADDYPDDALLLAAGFVVQNSALGSQSQEP